MNRDDPWAQHAVAHVLEARGEPAAGLEFLSALSGTWDRCSSFMYTHNWWHTALFRLDMDGAAASLALFDERVWGVRKNSVQDQVNAVSLLSRLELRDVDVGARWVDVAAHVRPRIHDRQNAFLDLHYLYALARAGEDEAVAEILTGMEAMPRPARRRDAHSGARSPCRPRVPWLPMPVAGSRKPRPRWAPCLPGCSCSAAAPRSRAGFNTSITMPEAGSGDPANRRGITRDLAILDPRSRTDRHVIRRGGVRRAGTGDTAGGDGAASAQPVPERRARRERRRSAISRRVIRWRPG